MKYIGQKNTVTIWVKRTVAVFATAVLIWPAAVPRGLSAHPHDKPDSAGGQKRRASRMNYNLIEYNRGMSRTTTADISVSRGNRELTWHNVVLQDRSLDPDGHVVPLESLKALATLRFVKAINDFTVSYYGIRYYRFQPDAPNWAWGIDFTHHKIYMQDLDQSVARAGKIGSRKIDDRVKLRQNFRDFNVSDGINQIGFSISHRWMYLADSDIPDGRLQPYVALSIGPVIPHAQLTLVTDGKKERLLDSFRPGLLNWGMDISLGVRWKFFNGFGVYLAIKESYTILHDLNFEDGSGELSTDFFSSHILWGVSFSF